MTVFLPDATIRHRDNTAKKPHSFRDFSAGSLPVPHLPR